MEAPVITLGLIADERPQDLDPGVTLFQAYEALKDGRYLYLMVGKLALINSPCGIRRLSYRIRVRMKDGAQ